MKRLCVALACLCLCSTALAADTRDYYACVEYLNSNQVVVAGCNFMIQYDESGRLIFSHWGLPTPQPTFAQMDAIMPQALAWKSNQVATAAADIDKMDLQLRAVIRALLSVVNQRLPAAQKITETELKAAIKDAAR